MRKLSKKAKRLIIDFSSAAADLTNKAIRPNFIQFGEARAALMDYIAELESENGRLQESWLWETVCPDGSLRPKVSELLLNLDGWKERSNGWESIVETLNIRIAELEAAQRWRVVADGELPEFGTSILFYDSILEKINKGTCTALDRDKTNLQWITDDGLYYHGNRCEYITRWMPLPELPKERER